MKKKTKDSKGITLIALLITVIILMILISVTTYTGINTYKNAQMTAFVTQMQLLQEKIDEFTSEEIEALNLSNASSESQILAITSAYNNGEVTSGNASSYKVFTESNILNILDVEYFEGSIMVNFETREIVSEKRNKI